MTILPKKHKPPPPPQAAQSGPPGGPGGDRDPEDGPGEHQEDRLQPQPNAVPGGNGAGGWGPGGFDGQGPGPSGWNGAPVSCSSSGVVHAPAGMVVGGGAEKRPAPSSVSAYGFDDDDDDDEGGAQCKPTASKRSRRAAASLGKRLKGAPRLAAAGAVPGASPASGSVAAAAVQAALTRPNVTPSPPLQGCSSWDNGPDEGEGREGGYNSEDEYSHLGLNLTDEEWEQKDRRFEKTMRKKGYIIKHMADDGSCLFRAVADQVFGDQEMHSVVRAHCMDYVEQNGDYFSQYITEDIETYVSRKRYHGVHGNHLEIQALSEMYSRPVHIFSYSTEPINTFQTIHKSDTQVNVPIRLSYHRGAHYNSLVDPLKPSIGVGLGLPGYSPGSADRSQMRQAVKASEESAVEKAMLEDKLKHTDWEATNDVIEEQVARESYLQWLKDNERRSAQEKAASKNSCPATVTSGELRSAAGKALAAQQQHYAGGGAGSASPKACCSKHLTSQPCAGGIGGTSPSRRDSHPSSPVPPAPHVGSPVPGSSSQMSPLARPSTSSSQQQAPSGGQPGFNETSSFLDSLPPDMFGLQWHDRDVVLAQVLAASQQEYFESLKKKKAAAKPGDDSSSAGSSPRRPSSPK